MYFANQFFILNSPCLVLLFLRQRDCVPPLICSSLSSEISLSILPRCLSASRSAIKVKCSAFHFHPLPPLQSSCRPPRRKHAHITAGFRCKSYLNLSPAATSAVRGDWKKIGRPGYRSNLQNEHFYGISRLRRGGNKLTQRGSCVSVICWRSSSGSSRCSGFSDCSNHSDSKAFHLV